MSSSTQNAISANRIAKWDATASTWSPLGSAAQNGTNNGSVSALAVIGADLYVGGSFSTASSSSQNAIGSSGFGIYGPIPVPEIVVEQPVGTALTDGTASIDCGRLSVGTTGTPVTFTVRNIGTTNLTLGTITKDGANPADFAVSAPGNVTVTPGNSTSFTVTFTPSDLGARNAAIHIANNLSTTKNPFDITLTGMGLTLQEAWRLTYFGITTNTGDATDLADPDGDGGNNLFEYVAGLVPTSPVSRFKLRVEEVTGQKAVIFSPLVAGRTYVVKSKASLSDPTWTGLTSFTTSDDGSERTVTDLAADNGPKFYIVEITLP